MSSAGVWPAMARAFDLARRSRRSPRAALNAAQAAGRCARQAVGGADRGSWEVNGQALADGSCLRVDDSRSVEGTELTVVLQRAYNHMNEGDLAVEARRRAMREYGAASRSPTNVEMMAARCCSGEPGASERLAAALPACVHRQSAWIALTSDCRRGSASWRSE